MADSGAFAEAGNRVLGRDGALDTQHEWLARET
jgi:hypothetical protein